MTRRNYDWQLPPQIEERLGEHSYGPQRIIHEAEHLLIILHEPPGTNNAERVPILFLRTSDGELFCNGKKDGRSQLKRLLSDYRARYVACEELYEKAGSAADLLKLMEQLSPLNRSSTNLFNTLQAARDAAQRDRYLIGTRDEANEISRSFDLLTLDTQHAVDYRIAKNAEEQARQSAAMTEAQHKLNILAAFTFPVMALATLFGMNMTSGLEERSTLLFWCSIGIGVIVGFFVKSWVLNTGSKK